MFYNFFGWKTHVLQSNLTNLTNWNFWLYFISNSLFGKFMKVWPNILFKEDKVWKCFEKFHIWTASNSSEYFLFIKFLFANCFLFFFFQSLEPSLGSVREFKEKKSCIDQSMSYNKKAKKTTSLSSFCVL